MRYMRLYERFSKVRVLSFCIMSNHFHILLEVPARPEDNGASWSDAKLLKHLATLYSGAKLREITQDLERYREQGNEEAAEELRNSFFRRMWDLSQYMKTLKTSGFRGGSTGATSVRGRCGSNASAPPWCSPGWQPERVAGYIDLNPVRAHIVDNAGRLPVGGICGSGGRQEAGPGRNPTQ